MVDALAAGVFALSALQVGATGPSVQVEVTQDRATARIEAPGDIAADLELRFEQVVGLGVESLGLSAELIDPAATNLLARLPASSSVPLAFPVLISIEPGAAGPLTFSGVVEISLHTHNLAYTPASPLRLLAAPVDGKFQDITSTTGMGSYRVGANKGGFSQFLIAADVRPVDTVIVEKFAQLQAVLSGNADAVPGAVLGALQAQLDGARGSYLQNDALAAATKVQQFADSVKQYSGSSIPNVWRSSRDLVNVAGELRAGASTLKYSLLYKASTGP